MKQGFTIFELIVSIMLTSMLLTATFTIYESITKASRRTQYVTTHDTKIMMIYNRLQKDLTGLSPLWFTKEPYKKLEAAKKESGDKSKPVDSDTKENGFFYSTNHDNESLNFMTFPTTSALQVYDSNNQPFIRVVYALTKNPKDDKTFSLMRKEIQDVTPDFKEDALLKKEGFYELASDIISCTTEYLFINAPMQPSDNKTKEEKKDEPAKMVTLKDWGVIKEKSEQHEHKPALPLFVKIKVTFASTNEKQQPTSTIVCRIPISPHNKLTPFVEKRNKTQKDTKDKDSKNTNKDKKEDHATKNTSTPKGKS